MARTLVEVFIVGTTVPVKSTLTDANGQYLVSGLAEGEYRVVISVGNYGSQPFRVVLTLGERGTLSAALQPNPATIRGQVTDAQTGNPISGAGVVTVITGSGIIVASAKTDLNGNYIISGLASGSYDVVFSADNFAAQTSTVNLLPNEIEIVNAALSSNPASVSGRVINTGTGVPFVTSTLSNVAGQYTLTGLPEGIFTISASATNFVTQSHTVNLTLSGVSNLNFSLIPSSSSLRGIVTDSKDGTPISDALVQVLVIGTMVPLKSTLSNSRRQYFISNLSNGEDIVVFSATNYVTLMFHIVIDAGEVRTLNVSLIEGRIQINLIQVSWTGIRLE